MAGRLVSRNLLSVARRAGVRSNSVRLLSYNVHKLALSSASVSVGSPRNVPVQASATSVRYYGEAAGMTVRELQDRVLTVLQLFDKVNPDKLTLESHFINDLGLDSLDVVEIVMAFEDEFGVEIDDEQAEKMFTPMDAVQFLRKEMDIGER